MKLKRLAPVALLFLNFLGLQISSSQAADVTEISLIQPDGTKKAMKLDLDQPLSELRNVLLQEGVNILPDDKFLVAISSKEEAQWSIREAISGDVLSFKLRGVTLHPTEASSGNIVEKIPTPLAPQEDEEIYRRFVNGALIYKPNPKSDVGMVTFPIRELENPLKGTFDLSCCGKKGKHLTKYLSISTGYRQGKKPENAKKIEIWICPRSLIEKEWKTTASHFKPIMDNWKQKKAPVGIFWTDGGESNQVSYNYLITQSMDELSKGNLYEKWYLSGNRGKGTADLIKRQNEVEVFYVSFEN